MADQNTSFESLRSELGNLAAQVENMVKSMEKKKASDSGELLNKIAQDMATLRASAEDKAHQMYKMGQSGMEDVSEQVRRNPIGSLLIAFGAGCIMSTILRHLFK